MLGDRDVEDLLAERGLDISHETVRTWVLKFGPLIAGQLRRRRPRASDRWHLDETVIWIAGKRMYLWRAVDHEGEVLDMLVQRRRDSREAVRLIRKLLKSGNLRRSCWSPTRMAGADGCKRDQDRHTDKCAGYAPEHAPEKDRLYLEPAPRCSCQ